MLSPLDFNTQQGATPVEGFPGRPVLNYGDSQKTGRWPHRDEIITTAGKSCAKCSLEIKWFVNDEKVNIQTSDSIPVTSIKLLNPRKKPSHTFQSIFSQTFRERNVWRPFIKSMRHPRIEVQPGFLCSILSQQ